MPGLRSFLLTLMLQPALLACGSDLIRWIPASGLESIVVIDEVEGASRPRLSLFQRSDERYLEELSPGRHTIFSLGFREPLKSLATPLELYEDGVELPPPDELRRLFVGPGAASPWQTLTELPTRLAALKLKAATPCLRLKATKAYAIPNPRPLNPTLLVPLGPGSFLLGTDVGPFFEVTASSFKARTELSTATPHQAGLAGPDGQIWLFGEGGAVMRAKLTPGSLAIELAPDARRPLAQSPFRQVVASRDGRPFELFTLTADRGIEHFDGQRWTVLRPPSGLPPDGHELSITWVKQGTVAFLESGTSQVTELDVRGGERNIDFELPQTHLTIDTLHVLGYFDRVGAMVGSDYGVVFRRDGQRWPKLPTPTSNRVQHFHSLQSAGFAGGLWGGKNGEYVQWWDTYDGSCPLVSFLNERDYEFIEPDPASGQLLAVNGALANGALSVTRIYQCPQPSCD